MMVFAGDSRLASWQPRRRRMAAGFSLFLGLLRDLRSPAEPTRA